ncbi:MAG: hypothetical protein AAGC55_18140, partial [Myxococcota bacterium]
KAALAAVLLAATGMVTAGPAAAQPGRDAPSQLRDAAQRVDGGEYERAVTIIETLLETPAAGARPDAAPDQLDVQDRAEAMRIYGLALFFLNRRDSAEQAFLEYLKLDVEARLDPNLVPPEVIIFFEDVRSRNAAELRKYRPKPKRKRMWLLNLLPPLGQFQNGQRGKGWILAGAETTLFAVNVSTLLILRSWCNSSSGRCVASDGSSRADSARTLRALNVASGSLLIGLVAYGIYDGIKNYGQADRDRPGIAGRTSNTITFGLAPSSAQTPGDLTFFIGGRF